MALFSLAGWGVVRYGLENALFSEASRQLRQAARLAAIGAQRAQELEPDSLAGLFANATGYRASVFDGRAALLADSDFPPRGERVGAVAPTEVAAALDRPGAAASIRESVAAGNARYVFAASRFFRRGSVSVLRLGMPAGPLEASARRQALLALGLFLGAGALLLVALRVLAARLVQGLTGVRRSLQRMAASGRPDRARLPWIVEAAVIASEANRLARASKERERSAAKERDELSQLVGQVEEGLISLDPEARIVRANASAQKLLGVRRIPPLAPVASIVRDPVLRGAMERALQSERARDERTVGDRTLEVRCRRTPSGGAVVSLVDITEIRRLEKVRADFVANASHELKTPLTVIRATAETILDGDVPAEVEKGFLRSIQNSAVRLQLLVDDLLDLSRYESGMWVPERDEVRIADLATDAWKHVAEASAAKGVRFELSGQEVATGDQNAIHQIFRNLFENAVRYVDPESGLISVRMERARDAKVLVRVRDNGVGVPAAALPRIFERFYRVDESRVARSKERRSTGLGLAIVRHLALAMGGEARARSELGAWTEISFTLPAFGCADKQFDPGPSSSRRAS